MPSTKTKPVSKKEETKTTPETKNPSIGQKASHVLENFKKHFEPAKVDKFQDEWLKLPKNRKKYEKITDAPQVAAEEILAMTNDLIQWMQGQEGGNSGLLKKIKSGFKRFTKNPAEFVESKAKEKTEVKSARGKIEAKKSDALAKKSAKK